MNKIMDKLLKNIKIDKKYMLFSLIITITGIIAGSLFIVILNSQDKSLVIEYIQNFINNIKTNNYNVVDLLKNTLLINTIPILLLLIFGITFIFSIINIIILFYKSFIIGFSISSFILTYKLKGILYSIIYVFPHGIINILIYAILLSYTLKSSLKLLKYIINKKELNIRFYINKYLIILLLSSIIIILTSIYEVFVVPILIKII